MYYKKFLEITHQTNHTNHSIPMKKGLFPDVSKFYQFCTMKVFLDDIRPAPIGWNLVRGIKKAIDLLKTGEVTEISLDHDLGVEIEVGTGYDVLLWIEDQVA